MLPRQLTHLSRFQDIKPGDILLFRPSKTPFSTQNLIMFFQKLVSLKHGHFDTIHVAVCVENGNGQPVIAHSYEKIVGDDEVDSGYVRHTLQEMLVYEGALTEGNEDRPFLIYRPKDKKIAKELAAVMGDEQANNHIKWTYTQAIKTFFQPAFWNLDPDRPINSEAKLPDEAICSQLVISALEVTEKNRLLAGDNEKDIKRKRVNMRSCSTPKALECYLYNNPENYELLVYPGQDAYKVLCREIENQLQRIKLRINTDKLACNKYYRGKRLSLEIRSLHCRKGNKQTDFEKCLELLTYLLPILSINTGWGFRTTASSAVLELARRKGIFQRDLDHYRQGKLMVHSVESSQKKNGK